MPCIYLRWRFWNNMLVINTINNMDLPIYGWWMKILQFLTWRAVQTPWLACPETLVPNSLTLILNSLTADNNQDPSLTISKPQSNIYPMTFLTVWWYILEELHKNASGPWFDWFQQWNHFCLEHKISYVNTKLHKRVTSTWCWLLQYRVREFITVHFVLVIIWNSGAPCPERLRNCNCQPAWQK